jgi:hypothetical protein
MNNILNKNEFNDFLILENIMNDSNYNSNEFFNINESTTTDQIISKIKNVINWLIKNINKIGIGIIKIVNKVLTSIKKFITSSSYKIIISIFLILMVQSSFANLTQNNLSQKPETELVISRKIINESIEILNSAIGFLYKYSNDNPNNVDIVQSVGVLVSIRDGLSGKDLDSKEYKYMTEKSKEIILKTIEMVKKESQGSKMFTDFIKIAEKLKSTVHFGVTYRSVTITEDNVVTKDWSRTVF